MIIDAKQSPDRDLVLALRDPADLDRLHRRPALAGVPQHTVERVRGKPFTDAERRQLSERVSRDDAAKIQDQAVVAHG